jgi:F0F1-type ATP synthase assembly protein I
VRSVSEYAACTGNSFSGKGNAMTQPEREPSKIAGGIFIAIGMLLGAILGVYAGQPSAGMAIGLIAGMAAALLVWAIDRKRNRNN